MLVELRNLSQNDPKRCFFLHCEAVTLLLGLVSEMGVERVKSNKCVETCAWPLHVWKACPLRGQTPLYMHLNDVLIHD